jgi:hypothetical protein
MHLEAGRASIRGRVGDLGLEELLQLEGSGGFARGGEAFGLVSNGVAAGASDGGVGEWNLRLG